MILYEIISDGYSQIARKLLQYTWSLPHVPLACAHPWEPFVDSSFISCEASVALSILHSIISCET